VKCCLCCSPAGFGKRCEKPTYSIYFGFLTGSYGSTKRYKSFARVHKVNEQTVIGAGGELSDFQYILTLLDELSNEDFCSDDDAKLAPKEIYAYLSRVLYNRRSKCALKIACLKHVPCIHPVRSMLLRSLLSA
jgi:hypothetical protein